MSIPPTITNPQDLTRENSWKLHSWIDKCSGILFFPPQVSILIGHIYSFIWRPIKELFTKSISKWVLSSYSSHKIPLPQHTTNTLFKKWGREWQEEKVKLTWIWWPFRIWKQTRCTGDWEECRPRTKASRASIAAGGYKYKGKRKRRGERRGGEKRSNVFCGKREC